MNPVREYFKQYIGKSEKERAKGIGKLRKTIPKIKRLESLDELKDLRLVRHTDDCGVVMLIYEASAPYLYPSVRPLLTKKVAKNGVVTTFTRNRGELNEFIEAQITGYGGSLQIILSVNRLVNSSYSK